MAAFRRYEDRRLRLIASCCRGRTVLDLGYAARPNPYFVGLHRVGVDLDQPSKRPEVDGKRIDYEEQIVGDVMDLGAVVGGRTFDNVVAGELIEHIEAPYAFLKSLAAFISPEGRLILSTPNPISVPVVLFEVLRSRRFFYTRNHVHYFCPRWVERMLELCGFRVLEVQGVGLWNPWIAIPCPASLSYQIIYVAAAARQGLP